MTDKNGITDPALLFTKAIKEELEASMSDDENTYSYDSDQGEE
jgi:hypothetical protein